MAVLKDLIVHGSSRFLNGIYSNSIHSDLIAANSGVFRTITTTTLDADTITADMLKANNARVAQTLTVDGTISTNKWEAASIANIGGNFYISPTGKSDSGTITVTKTGSTTINGVSVGVYTLVVGGTFGVTSTNDTIWGNNSKVIFTGSISYNNSKKFPLGSCSGTMTTKTTGTNTLTGFTITGVNSSALDIFFKEVGIASISSTACNGYEMQISVYQSYSSSNLRPVGILLTSYGKEKKQYIDIYGGSNVLGDADSGFADPEVRIGQLDGLPNIVDGSTSTDTKPTGWGIYTTNGFFKGKIVANAGRVGNWVIENGSSTYGGAIYTGSFGSDNGIFITPSYTSSTAIGGSSGSQNWTMTASNKFGVTKTGYLYASKGKIAGWTIDTNKIYSGTHSTWNSTAEDGLYLGNDGIAGGNGGIWYLWKDGSAKIGAMTLSASGVLAVPAANITGTLTASQIDVSGVISSGDIVTNTLTGGTFNTADYIRVSTQASSSLTIGTSGAKTDWRIIAGKTFGVDKAGNVYATSITATGGTIGGWTISSSSIYSSDTSTIKSIIAGTRTASSTGDGVYIGSNGVLNVGEESGNYLTFDGTNLNLKTDWLKFDSTAKAVIIGNNNNAMSANISGSDFILKDKDSNPFFYAGDLRGGENAKITESIVAGTRFNYIRLDVSYKIETSDEVTVTDSNGNTIQCTIGSNGYYLTSDDLIDGDTYTVVYYTAEPLYAITFTQRDPNYGTVIGANSVNFAYNGRCSGSGAFCEGYATTASGKFSHAEGRSSRASGDYSHAEGESFAENRDAHAEGGDCYARGGWSHAEGYKCESNATYSHAGGFYSKAEGYKSYARGDNVVAQGCGQFVIGKYNDPQGSETTIDNSDYAFIIGNGTSSVLSNALTVDWKGVTSYYGDVTNTSLQIPPNSSTISSVTYAANSGGKITEISFTKKGNLAMIRFQVTSTSAISSGSNILTAQLVSKYHPAQYATGVGYYGGHAIVGRINTSGQLIIRNASSSGVTLSSSNGGVEVAFTYILKDYFV